jgi:hypothetical protein
MAIEGSLDLFGMPEILQMIAQQGKTGILTVQGQQDIVAVSFLNGWVVAADSLAHTVEEGLSKLLVSEGLLSAGEFARAAAENQAAGARLLDFLIDRGYLSREQLLAVLRQQTVNQLEPLLRWQEGDFKFYSGDEVSYEEGFEPISVEDLLLRSLADFGSFPGPAVAKPAGAGLPAPAAASGAPPPPPPAAGGGGQRPAVPARGAPAPPGVPGPLPAAAPARPQPRPAAPPPPAGAPGRATQVRGTSGPAVPQPQELRLPEIPDLPEIAMPELPPSPAAALPPPPARSGPPPMRTSPAVPPAPAAPAEPLPWPAAATTQRPVVAGPPPASMAQRLAGAGPSSTSVAQRPGGAGSPAAALAGSRLPGAGGGTRQLKLPAAAAPATPQAAAVAGVLVPPPGAALPRKFRQMQLDRPAVPATGRWVVGALALGLAVLLASLVRLAPATLALPFPWEGADRGAFERNQREALFNKIDGAAKTAFLRDGRFPDRLAQLRDSGLLAPDDLLDPRGEPLQYTAREDSYTLQATAGGKPLADADASDSIAGNFLLDPTLLQNKSTSGPPIVLLD